MQMTVLIVALLAGVGVLSEEHYDEMPLKHMQPSETISVINYKHEKPNQSFNNVYNQRPRWSQPHGRETCGENL